MPQVGYRAIRNVFATSLAVPIVVTVSYSCQGSSITTDRYTVADTETEKAGPELVSGHCYPSSVSELLSLSSIIDSQTPTWVLQMLFLKRLDPSLISGL